MQKLLHLLFLLWAAQNVALPRAALKDESALGKAMPDLARSALAGYKEADREKYLDTLFRLQMVAGQYSESLATLKSLRDMRKGPYAAVADIQYEIYSNAKLKQGPFEDAFKQSFRETFSKLDDRSALVASGPFNYDLDLARADLQDSLKQWKDNSTIDDVVALAKKYQPYSVYKEILPMSQALVSEDDHRRYDIQDDLLIKTRHGATISAMLVRKKGVTTPQPTALVFTIYAEAGNYRQAKQGAAYGYAGMLAFTRGKALSPDAIEPYEHETEDIPEVIDWIGKQPWSDGQVGMYGGSYNGFTQWAATKNLHPALKTIATYVAAIPGQGLPMENNVFLSANYGWAFYVTDNKYLDDKIYSDPNRWGSLYNNWYASGKPYRDIDKVDGVQNPWLQRWLQHPAYDKYWQDMVPYKQDYSRINIPVLTITGYYDDGQISAIQYLKEHYKYNHNANHYLLIGPYDHFGAQGRRKQPVLRGYAIDPVAQIDTVEVTFQWLDYCMRGGPRPELIKDKINYEVMGANVWRHAPSLEEASNETLTLYLTGAKLGDRYSGDRYALSAQKPSHPGFLLQQVDLADRKTQNNDYYPFPILGKKPDLSNGFSFISEPFDQPVSINGTFSGEIKASINKKDMDIGIVLYEVLPSGELLHLSYFLGRASYARDPSVRHLLTPGRVESIPFDRTRMISRKLEKGSRLLVTLNVNKNRFCQINYGTGKDVSDEDISDAKVPLQVKWYGDSYLKIPVSR